MTRPTLVAVFSIGVLGLTGCLLNHSNHTVVRQDEPLYPVTFESEHARATYEFFVEDSLANDENESHSSFAVPFVMGISKSKTTSETAIRNDVATRLDLNGDRQISDYETSVQR